MAIMTKTQWNKLQTSLPVEDRTTYEEYLASQGLTGSTANLDAAGSTIKSSAEKTIAELQALGVGGGAPTVTPRSSGIGIDPGSTPTVATPLTGTTIPASSGVTKDKTVQPVAPEGYEYKWIGSTKTGSWKLYKLPTPSGVVSTGGSSTGGNVSTGGSGTTSDSSNTATTDLSTYLAQQAAADKAQAKVDATKSAYNIIKQEFESRGLGALIPELKTIMEQGLTDSAEIRLYLQNTDAYKKRFAANEARVKAGLRALTPAEYTSLEDQYQEVMRRYGLPAAYYSKNDLGVQEGFNKLIANDVSNTELEDRINTAQSRLINTDVNTLNALRQFYPNITNGDLLAYVIDPTNALGDIKRKAQAAEIGGAALGQGLTTSQTDAEALAKYGITKAQAQQGYQTIGQFLPTATNLAQIYQGQGLGPYTQATAEQEIFGTASAAEAARKRKKLSELEQAQFSAKSGASQGALSRDRAMSPYMLGTPGAGAF